MNKWKIAFWVCLGVLLFVMISGFLFYIKQEITHGFIKEDRNAYKEDLEITTTIITKGLRTKSEIEEEFKVNGHSPFFNETMDMSFMLRTKWTFKNDSLVKVVIND